MHDPLHTPNCPNCLHQMEPREFKSAVAWWCPRCEVASIG